MKKTININLGGYAMTIDEDAYQYLGDYLENIKLRFYNSEGRDEILSDIEARMGELLSTNLGSRAVVQFADVESVVDIMGKPEEFGTDPMEEETMANTKRTDTNRSGSSKYASTGNKGARRLYRDEDDATVAGVCSGLASYFGIQDPVWMRLIFVLLTFLSAGFWIPAYFLLWMLIPVAKSSSDRLSMKGEPINVDNIAREIEEGFDRFGNKVSEFGESVKKKSGGTGSGLVSFITKIVGFIGRLFGAMVRLFSRLFQGLGIFIAFIVFISLTLLWVVSAWVGVFSNDWLSFFSPLTNGQTLLGMTNILFLIGLPLIGLFLFFARLLFRFKTPTILGVGIIGLWLVNLFSSSVLAAKGVQAYRASAEIGESFNLPNSTDVLFVDLIDEDFNDRSRFRHNNLGINSSSFYIDGKKLYMEGDYQIYLEKATDGVFRLDRRIISQGSDQSDARQHASEVEYTYTFEGNRLTLPKHYTLQEGGKFRDQKIEITLCIPEGKKLQFNGEAAWHTRFQENQHGITEKEFRRDPDQLFTMSSNGLLCEACPSWGDAAYSHYGNLNNFDFDGPFIVEISKGEHTSLRIEANKELINQIRNSSNNDNLSLKWEGSRTEPIRIYIESENIEELKTSGSCSVTIFGFDTYRVKFRADEESSITADFEVENVEIRSSDKAKIQLKGEGSYVSIIASDTSVVDADRFVADHVDLVAHDKAEIRAYAERNATQKTTQEGKIQVRGDANNDENK